MEFKGQMFFLHGTTWGYKKLQKSLASSPWCNNGRLNFVLLNIYNTNIEKEQLSTLTKL